MSNALPELVYSLNEESYEYDSAEEAYDAAVGNMDIKDGEKLLMWRAKPKPYKHQDFISLTWFFDTMADNAYEEAGEYAEVYGDVITRIPYEKQQELEKVIGDWLDANVEKPGFYTVENIEAIYFDGVHETLAVDYARTN